jgi:hypothetical protein
MLVVQYNTVHIIPTQLQLHELLVGTSYNTRSCEPLHNSNYVSVMYYVSVSTKTSIVGLRV